MDRYVKIFIIVPALLWGLALSLAVSQAAAPLEYQVKAAFVYKFTKFVEWPADRLNSRDEPIVIGVLGESPITEALQSLTQEQTEGQRLEVRHVIDPGSISGLHILFISPTDVSQLLQVLDSANGSHVLTVSENDGYASMGVMVNFYIDREKIRLEINNEAAKEAGLKISSKLLRLAKIVRSQNKGK